MTMSSFPNGFKGGVAIRGMSLLNMHPGKVFWVDSVNGTNGDGSFQQPYTTIANALVQCLADRGDIIMCKAKHAETISAAGGITLNVAGIAVIGLGHGQERPTLTFDTATTASLLISAAGVTVQNIIGVTAFNALTNPIDVTASDAFVDMTWRDASTILEAVTVLRAVTVSRLVAKLRIEGQTGGSAGVRAVSLNGVSGADIELDVYGKYSTAVVNLVTVASTNVNVRGTVYNSGTTDGSKLVIDTITGSTWTANLFDGAAGASFSGGSGAAIAADDVSVIAGLLVAPVADAATATNMRDSVGIKTDAAVVAVGTTKSIMAYVKGILSYLLVGTADGTANASAADVIGNKTDAAVNTVTTNKSLMGYVKALVNREANFATKAAAVIVNGDTLFTVAGGPIAIEALWSECVTGNDGTASTLQYSCTPTAGAAQTISAASASLAAAAIGASVSLIGTALSTAALLNANGPNLGMSPGGGIIAPAGTIKAVVGVGSTTGTWRHYIRYKPLAAGVTVS